LAGVFGEDGGHAGALDLGEAGGAKFFEDGFGEHAGVHGFPEVFHHELGFVRAGEELGEGRVDVGEVESEEAGADGVGGFGGFEQEDFAAGFEDAVEFAEGGAEIAEMAQGVADREKIEGLVGQGEFFGAGADEGGFFEFFPGDGEHAVAGVHAGDGFGRSEDFGGGGGDQSGAAGHVEQFHARFEAVAFQCPFSVEVSQPEEPPSDHGVVMFRAFVEEFLDEDRFFLGSGVVLFERRVWKHGKAG